MARPRVRPHRLNETIHDLADGPLRRADAPRTRHEETARKIAECDRKLAGYRAALDAGADPGTSPRGSPRPKPRKPATSSARPHRDQRRHERGRDQVHR